MIDYLRKYPEFILIAMGASFLAGAIFNWSLITASNSSRKNPIVKLTFYYFGEKGYRLLIGMIGLIILMFAIYGLIEK